MSEQAPETSVEDPVDRLISELTATEPATADTSQAEPATEQELLAGKFQSPQELEQAYLEAQKLIGKQGNELGDLRQAVREEIQQAFPPQQQPQQVPLTDQVVSAFDDLIAENPGQAAQWALQSNQPMLYERAMENWYVENPKDATRFEMSLQRQQEAARAEFAAQASQAEQAQFLSAWDSFKQQHPDLDQYGQVMMQIANEAPAIAKSFETMTPAERAQWIPVLYDAARTRAGQPSAAPAVATANAPYVAQQNTLTARDAPAVFDPLGIKKMMSDHVADEQARRASLFGQS